MEARVINNRTVFLNFSIHFWMKTFEGHQRHEVWYDSNKYSASNNFLYSVLNCDKSVMLCDKFDQRPDVELWFEMKQDDREVYSEWKTIQDIHSD